MQGWRQFEGHIPADERADLVAAYHKRLTSEDTAVRDAAVSMPLFDTYSLIATADPAALMEVLFCKSLVHLDKVVQHPVAPHRN